MTTTHTLTGNLADVIGSAVKSPVVTIDTNLPQGTALVDLDANEVRMPGAIRVAVDSDLTFATDLIATNSTGTNIPDGSLRYVVRVQYVDATNSRRSWTSGWFDLTANANLATKANTDAGALVDIEAVVLKATINDAVEEAVEGHTPGTVLGSVRREASATSTAAANTSGDIAGMAVTIVGQGRPVEVTFHAASVYHSVAGTVVSAVVMCNANLLNTNNQICATQSSATNTGPSMHLSRLTGVLTDGVSYTFQLRVWGSAAGTCTLVGANFCPIELTVKSV